LSQLDFTFFVSILSFGKTKILTLYYVNRGVHFGLQKIVFNFLVNNKFRKENRNAYTALLLGENLEFIFSGICVCAVCSAIDAYVLSDRDRLYSSSSDRCVVAPLAAGVASLLSPSAHSACQQLPLSA
jgi:hypothetical protein